MKDNTTESLQKDQIRKQMKCQSEKQQEKQLRILTEQIRAYKPFNEQEEADRKILLNWLEGDESILTRENKAAHLTASAWVISPDRKYVLMAYHNIYHSWAWLGGHADGDANLHDVARKEVIEESGVSHLKFVSDEPFSIEILSVDGHVKRGQYVSTHLHLNVTYLIEADSSDQIKSKPDENSAVEWIPVEKIAEKSTEPWFVEHIYQKLCQKVTLIKK